MSALKKKTEPVNWRTAGDPSHERMLPGGTSYEPVTLEQGLTHDPVFENWANLVNNIQGDAAMSLKNFRKDIVINVLNLQGQVAISYKLFRAWVSDFQALPDLDAGSMNTVGIQTHHAAARGLGARHGGGRADGILSHGASRWTCSSGWSCHRTYVWRPVEGTGSALAAAAREGARPQAVSLALAGALEPLGGEPQRANGLMR